MTKEQVIRMLQGDGYDIMYEYYLEKRDKSKREIGKREFVHTITMYPYLQDAFDIAVKYYENKFDITRVHDSSGVFIKMI